MPDDENSAPNSDEDSSRMNSSAAKPDPYIGRVMDGRFEILNLIARGGMGKVYRARQQPLGRICALKVLNPAGYDGEEDPEFAKRFFLEASTASKLSHENTVTIYDYGRDGETYFIAMEYIEGKTLYQVLRQEGPLPDWRVAGIMRAVCRSLREAHELGVIHRDIKPANIALLAGDEQLERVKVLDFGLAKIVREDGEDLTQKGMVMGSPKYMAPEQILGNDVAPPTDIYALGVVAFEMLTGAPPFDRQHRVKTLMAHIHDPVPEIVVINPDVQLSPEMEGLVYRCLQKDPDHRYATTRELVEALSHIDGGGGPATTASGPYPSVRSGQAPSSGSSTRGPRSVDGDEQPTLPYKAADLPEADSSPSARAAQGSQEVPSTLRSVIPPARRSSSRRLGPPAAVGVAVVVGAVAAISFSRSNESAPLQADKTRDQSSSPTPDSLQNPPEATGDHQVRIVSQPPGAAVMEGDHLRCVATPCSVSWPRNASSSAQERVFRVRKRGYETAELVVKATDTERKIELVRDETPPDQKTARAKNRRPIRRHPRPVKTAAAKPTAATPSATGYKDDPYKKDPYK